MKTKIIALCALMSFMIFSLALAEEKKDNTTNNTTASPTNKPPTPEQFNSKKPFPKATSTADVSKREKGSTQKSAPTNIAASVKNAKKIDQENSALAKNAETKKWNISEALGSDSDLSMLHALLKQADLLKTLESGEYTLFAPTNEAFQNIPSDEFKALGNNNDKLKNVLLYHIAKGHLSVADVVKLDGQSNQMMNGATAMVSAKGSMVMLNQAKVKYKDIKCTNGMIHIIDHVIMQDYKAPAKNLSVGKKPVSVENPTSNIAPTATPIDLQKK